MLTHRLWRGGKWPYLATTIYEGLVYLPSLIEVGAERGTTGVSKLMTDGIARDRSDRTT